MVFCERFKYSADSNIRNGRFNSCNGYNYPNGISSAGACCIEFQNYDGHYDDRLRFLSNRYYYNQKSS
jgi:hypothetical protein